ncbi:MAG: (2Fe-2S)-binding protein [Burkholderiales bacterium]
MTTTFTLNGASRSSGSPTDTPLLYVLRDEMALVGTRFGCGLNQCGACNVLVDGFAVASCDTPLWAVAGKQVVTVEGLGTPETPHPVQAAILAEQAGQCGYCLSGIVVSAAALLKRTPKPTDAEINAALDKNLCRCGSHLRILRAVRRAAAGGAV